ncbi:Protein GRISEA [Lachnellula hyalina]|uniref:Protein GRISEA n=1 Tax=Lachnellula hyalina TaxID=1316788 RepID=A0A8H8QYW7_9HELO|nr:Protein GRISEA [Lachnellula hyalina]TVY25021.1 Protein GRISEA [Lachnellula hyalina]
MPLINGMKMACEPCIRGHRSTKCTHACERLMVPVRKPGRPLSQCPHPGGESCMCGSVTAAIPRKQACHCGGEASPPLAAQIVSRTITAQGVLEPLSPTINTFKVQKSSRPQSSRKQSFDPAKFERMDMNNVNVLPFEQRGQVAPLGMALPEGYPMSAPPAGIYGYAPQYTGIQQQYHPNPTKPLPMPYDNGFTSGGHSRNGSYGIESPIPIPATNTNGESMKATSGGSCCAPQPPVNLVNVEPKPVANGRSCCAPKQNNQSTSIASTIPKPEEITAGSCCAPKPTIPKEEPTSMNGTPLNMSPASSHQMPPQQSMPFNPALYHRFPAPATVFTYPAAYGSFQNPLQMSAWQQGKQSNYYSQPQPEVSIPPEAPSFNGSLMPGSMDTVHTCNCGDTCQCIGCAAHPYNVATQNYVHSAWASMSMEQPSELYTDGQNPIPTTNGNIPVQPQNVDQISSPTVHTPSSTTSGNGEEQSLSASDFFFVNYPFSDDSCGGDTVTCPCGDDCECLGCTIHRQPSM